jgi:Tfp pilus assembly PilM family ATPase
VNPLHFLNPPCLFIEIGQTSLKILAGDNGRELPLERLENGRLTAPCREQLVLSLRGFLKKPFRWPRQRAFCAIGARGVSLRRLTLPASTKEELQRILLLQIESEFPLPPDELAWGYSQLNQENLARNGASTSQNLIVVALKREALEEYSELLSECGISPVFILGALARSRLCPKPSDSYAILDIGRSHSELMSFDNGAPSSIRILPWGGEDLTRAIEKGLAISHNEAEKLKTNFAQESVSNDDLRQQVQSAIQAELDCLAGSINGQWTGRKLYLTGRSAALRDIGVWLAKALGEGVECECLESMPGQGRSAAILGLKEARDKEWESPPLIIQVKRARSGDGLTRPAQWKWVALAASLAIGSLSLPYAEALVQKPRLSGKLSQLKAYRDQLPKIDQELNFLLYLKTNQPPYLDAISIIANAAPPGARIESLAMNRRGDLSLRAVMGISPQTVDFRSKLIESGLFATVVVEEQTPTPDRQKSVVRISAQWKPASVRKPLSSALLSQNLQKSNTSGIEVKSGRRQNTAPSLPEAARTSLPPVTAKPE